jgi:hypothetical protein
MKIIATLIILILLGGCATNLTDEYRSEMLNTQRDILTRPLVNLKCPTTGCYILGLEVSNPSSYNTTVGVKETNGYDVTNTLIESTVGVVKQAIPYAAIGYTVNKLGNTSTSSTSSVTTSTTETTITNTGIGE